MTGDECDLCPLCWKAFREEAKKEHGAAWDECFDCGAGIVDGRCPHCSPVLETEEGIRGGQGRAPGRLARSADLLIVGLFVGLAIVGVAVLFSCFRHLG